MTFEAGDLVKWEMFLPGQGSIMLRGRILRLDVTQQMFIVHTMTAGVLPVKVNQVRKVLPS